MNTELFEQQLETADEILASIMRNYVHHLDERKEIILQAFARLKFHINEAEFILKSAHESNHKDFAHCVNTMLGDSAASVETSTLKESAGERLSETGIVRQNEQTGNVCIFKCPACGNCSGDDIMQSICE